MPSHLSQSPFPARFAALPAIHAAIGAVCRDLGIGAAVRLRVELALEELFANTVHHGYGAECERPVWIAARGVAGGIQIEYEDAAAAFDPFSAPPDADAPLERQDVGGLGCLLVRNVASGWNYQRVGGRNRTTLLFAAADDPV